MKYSEFNEMIMSKSMKIVQYDQYFNYLQHETRDDKHFREELLIVYAVAKHRQLPDDAEIKIGGEQDDYDACINGELIEITQALPEKEHEIRQAIASGSTTPAQHWSHANDHFQFPKVIINAIEKKHEQLYSDKRTLVVAFDGDYSGENDDVISGWISEIRKKSKKGNFTSILIVERARRKAFEVL